MTRPTEASLKADWRALYRFIKAERAMREWVFRGQPDKLAQKLAEIDAALDAAERIKDAAKASLPQQQPLIEEVRRKRNANGY